MVGIGGAQTWNTIQKSPQVDERQWAAIRSMLSIQNELIRNQTELFCEIQEVDWDQCDRVRPVEPLDPIEKGYDEPTVRFE